MHSALIALAVTLLAGQVSTAQTSPAGSVTVPGCVVTSIDEVEVPAQEAGVLMQVEVVEGQQVNESQLMAQIDDKQVRAMAIVAQCKLDVAEKEASNDINERFARKAFEVAKAEVRSAEGANQRAPGAVPRQEITRLVLESEKAELQIEQAVYEHGIAVTTIEVRKAELAAAQEDVARRKILAPLAGVVEKVYRRKGEWVQAGEPVVKVLRTDRLWIEGDVDAAHYTQGQVRQQPVVVTIGLPGRQEQFQGKIVFASEAIDAGPKFQIKAEVENRQDPRTGEWLLHSGQSATMTIQLR